jgi:peptidoglycan/xylan/chitin deacetylase (PgdA/CDA1 family)
MRNALSIDLEDWFHAELIRARVRGARPERRVPWAVEPILELLQRYDVRATFFVVGDVLRHHPDLVRRLYAEGHESLSRLESPHALVAGPGALC